MQLDEARRNLGKNLPPDRFGWCFMRGNGKPPNKLVAAPLSISDLPKGRVAERPNARGAL